MHPASAIIFTCIDWRLHPRVEEFLRDKYGSFDLCATAGSVKGFTDPKIRAYFLEQIMISKQLHNIKKAVLTIHSDCGAYGGSAAFANAREEIVRHTSALLEIKSIVKERFPRLKIELYFIDLTLRRRQWIPVLRQVR
ncbi:MAG: hypothetical protein HY564_00595 [Candidatus Jacksonbacteria bacterium]|nr:hypothetical protein [Candidatus Jacksonbacteria bacterium]